MTGDMVLTSSFLTHWRYRCDATAYNLPASVTEILGVLSGVHCYIEAVENSEVMDEWNNEVDGLECWSLFHRREMEKLEFDVFKQR